jgi:hypothetical protein
MNRLRAFLADDRGAVTFDWVVMTAASVALTLALMGQISDALEAASLRLSERMTGMVIPTSFEDWDAMRADMAAQPETED